MSLEAFSEQCLIELSRCIREDARGPEWLNKIYDAGDWKLGDAITERLARNPDSTELEVAA